MARRKPTDSCGVMEKLYKDGDILIEELAHTALEGSTKSSTLYFIRILSSLGASPCEYLKTKRSECRLIAKGVPQDGKVWDLYLMNCHYGPPCEFFKTL